MGGPRVGAGASCRDHFAASERPLRVGATAPRRLRDRGCTPETPDDQDSLRPGFASSVMACYRRILKHPVAGRGTELDINGLDPDDAAAAAASRVRELMADNNGSGSE